MTDSALTRAAADAFVKASSGPADVAFLTLSHADSKAAFQSILKVRKDANPAYWVGVKFISTNGAQRIETLEGGRMFFQSVSGFGGRSFVADLVFVPDGVTEEQLLAIIPMVDSRGGELITY